MLHDAYTDVKKNYYDPQYHGIDLDARYHEFETRLAAVTTVNDGMRIVQGFLDGLKDSHTFLIPPEMIHFYEPGFVMQMIGDQCFVVRVRPGTDAALKLHPGDRVIKYNSFSLNRDDILPAVMYFTVLNPMANTELDLQGPDGTLRHESVKAIYKPTGMNRRLRWYTQARNDPSILLEKDDVSYWRVPQFDILMDEVNRGFVVASKHHALVLDLRGDPGGSTDTLTYMLAGVLDHDVKVGDRIGRKNPKPFIAKRPISAHLFTGKLIVLIDSESGSAAELFARVMQLEHRGTVIGDKSAGAVMEAEDFPHSSGDLSKVSFGFSVTEADLIMTDGKSLEHVGVTPDEVVVPSPYDLSAGRDPAMARAAALAGANLSPEDAAKVFPIQWLPL